MPFQVVRQDIATMEVDAVVNAANTQLLRGGGVCGAIFEAAGPEKLQEACAKIGHVDTGAAVATPGFDLPARYVIHTAGPVWEGGSSGERELLASCYTASLELAESLGCTSVAFPLISSGAYGYPRKQAYQVAVETITAFLFADETQRADVARVSKDPKASRLRGDLSEASAGALEPRRRRRADLSRDDMDVYLVIYHHDASLMDAQEKRSLDAFVDYQQAMQRQTLERLIKSFGGDAGDGSGTDAGDQKRPGAEDASRGETPSPHDATGHKLMSRELPEPGSPLWALVQEADRPLSPLMRSESEREPKSDIGAQKAEDAAAREAWTCPCCGTANDAAFCVGCGAPKPASASETPDAPAPGAPGASVSGVPEAAGPVDAAEPVSGWSCLSCGAHNQTGAFCTECGAPHSAMCCEDAHIADSLYSSSGAGVSTAAGFGSAPQRASASSPSSAESPRQRSAASLDELLKSLDAPFGETLLAMIDARGLTDSDVYHAANMTRQAFSRLRSGGNPKKQTVLALCVALRLDADDAELLLRRAGYAFNPADAGDMIIEWYLMQGEYDINQINLALFEHDQRVLGSATYA